MAESRPDHMGLDPFGAPARPACQEPKLEQLSKHQLRTLRLLCDLIIPPDDESPGAVDAGAPDFIDLLASENPSLGLCISGGLTWLDSIFSLRYGHVFANCSVAEQHQVLDIIAYREKALGYPELRPGHSFFVLVRRLTLDGFFTSAVGYRYLRYIGNEYLSSFEGCPPFPVTQRISPPPDQ
jgi:gluconate 2-dehydrogenase gamma chain